MTQQQDNLKRPRPDGWSASKLTTFFEQMWGNTIKTFTNKEEARRLCRIDDLMDEIATDLRGVVPTVATGAPLFMFFRAHAAYRAACALGMSGMTVEGMALLRLCLEFASYACFLKAKPELAMVWWSRDDDEKTREDARNKFTAKKMKGAVKGLDERLGKIYADLYDWTIQWGAHPNEKTVTQGIEVSPFGQTVYEPIYLQGDGYSLDVWIRTADHVGICALNIFEHVHHERLKKLNVRTRIDVLVQEMRSALADGARP